MFSAQTTAISGELDPLVRYVNKFKQLADIKAEEEAQFRLEIHSVENRHTPNTMYVIQRPCQIKMASLIVEHNELIGKILFDQIISVSYQAL